MTLARCVRCWDPGPWTGGSAENRLSGVTPTPASWFYPSSPASPAGCLPLQGGQLRDPLEEGVRGPRHGVRERPLTWGAGEGAGGRERWRKGTRGWGWGV